MRKSTSPYPGLAGEATGFGVVSQAGAVALARTAQATELTTALSAALMPWRKPLASHDPGKIVCDLAVKTSGAATIYDDIFGSHRFGDLDEFRNLHASTTAVGHFGSLYPIDFRVDEYVFLALQMVSRT